MMALRLLPALAVSALVIASSGAMAANYSTGPAPAPAKPVAKMTSQGLSKITARSPESTQCSQDADAKGLHGKDRDKFRAACKTTLKPLKPVPGFDKS